jgi:GAF domain-containing protein
MPIDRPALERALERLESGHLLDLDVAEALQRVVEATKELFGVSGAGLMVVDDQVVLRYVAASDEAGRILEAAQEQLGSGPCVDSLVHGRIVATRDVTTDPRWPGLAELIGSAGVHAVLGIPVLLAGAVVGSLNVYADVARDWDTSEQQALAAFTIVIEQVIGTAVLTRRKDVIVDQLQYALDHRVVIERAVGVVMGRDGLDSVHAFNQLRMLARSQRRRVVEVAEELLAELD